MKINQIASILNTTIKDELIGESAVVAEDLSNIVDVGKTALDYFEEGADNLDNFVKSIIDKVGRTIFVDRQYKSTAPRIYRDNYEYGSVLEKIRCEVPNLRDSLTWGNKNTDASHRDPFIFSPPTVTAKYYNTKNVYQSAISFAPHIVKGAFKSPIEMTRFFAMIENRVKMWITLYTDALIMRTINVLIAEKIHSGNNVVNLLTLYNATVTTPLTAEQAIIDKDFLRFSAKVIANYRDYIKTASKLYNDGDYVTFTPYEKQELILLTEYESSLQFNLYSNTYHKEDVMLGDYDTVPYWQGSGTDRALSEVSKIDIQLVSDDEESVSQSYVIGVLFDRDGAMVTNSISNTEASYNPRGRYTTYFTDVEISNCIDTDENCVVFLLA